MRKSYWITFAISIHAPHVGRDSKSVQKFAALLRKVNNFLFASHLQYQRTLHIVSRLCSKVLDFGLILISEIVKAKAILLAVHYLT